MKFYSLDPASAGGIISTVSRFSTEQGGRQIIIACDEGQHVALAPWVIG
jgi:hypothetical protein